MFLGFIFSDFMQTNVYCSNGSLLMFSRSQSPCADPTNFVNILTSGK